MLRAEQLTFGYGPKPVLQNINLQLAAGQVVALLGPSGCGKTTLLKCLAGLLTPQAGTLTQDAQSFHFPGPPVSGWWPGLTVVFQQLFLWPHLTLRQNILLPHARTQWPALNAKLAPLLAQHDLTAVIDHYPNTSSRGQQQRAALLRALLLQPRYLLCDEITSALDIEQVAAVQQTLEATKAAGVGILLITHSLRFAARAADTIIFMEHGQILEQGPPSLLQAPQTPRFAQFLQLVQAAS